MYLLRARPAPRRVQVSLLAEDVSAEGAASNLSKDVRPQAKGPPISFPEGRKVEVRKRYYSPARAEKCTFPINNIIFISSSIINKKHISLQVDILLL